MAHSINVTKTIVETVADYEHASPHELPPLEDKLDEKTYQQLTAPEGQLSEPPTFEYLFYDISVLPDGEVVVTP